MRRLVLVTALLLILASCGDAAVDVQGQATATTGFGAAPTPITDPPGDGSPAVVDRPTGPGDQEPGVPVPAPTTLPPAAGAADGSTPPPHREEVPEPPGLPEPVSTTVPAGVTGEVPGDLLAAVLEDFSARTGLAADRAAVAIAESVIWPDGSLGCPAPGDIYEQAPVAGYRVLLQAGGTAYDYHLAASGYFVLCPPPAHP